MPVGSKAQAVQTSKGHDDKSVESENLEKRETKTKTTSKALTAALVIRKNQNLKNKRKEKKKTTPSHAAREQNMPTTCSTGCSFTDTHLNLEIFSLKPGHS